MKNRFNIGEFKKIEKEVAEQKFSGIFGGIF